MTNKIANEGTPLREVSVKDELTGAVVLIRKLPDDPITNRVSIGGKDNQYYCVYRGDKNDIKAILENCLRGLEFMEDDA